MGISGFSRMASRPPAPVHQPEAPRLTRSAWALGTYLFTTSQTPGTSILSSSPDQVSSWDFRNQEGEMLRQAGL